MSIQLNNPFEDTTEDKIRKYILQEARKESQAKNEAFDAKVEKEAQEEE